MSNIIFDSIDLNGKKSNELLYPFSKMDVYQPENSPINVSPLTHTKTTPDSIEKSAEPLLIPDEGRYVMFPIKYDDVWSMYKKQMDSFWRCEEINMSKDLGEWEKMNDDEKYFIKMVLAFFAASDGIVLENLAQRFMNDIENSEIRAFYSMQIFMENIHCVSADTAILTDRGYFEIGGLENQSVNVWNGKQFSKVTVKYTGNQELYLVSLTNGMELRCTPGHKWIVVKDGVVTRVTTAELVEGETEIAEFDYPLLLQTENGFHENEVYDWFVPNVPFAFEPPTNRSFNVKLEWMTAFLREYATFHSLESGDCLYFANCSFDNISYFQKLQLFFSTMGISTHLTTNTERNENGLVIWMNSKNKQMFDKLYIDLTIVSRSCEEIVLENGMADFAHLRVQSVFKVSDDSPTFCFNEPLNHAGVFNGILTGQSEMYSILIDTYSRDKAEKDRLLNSIQHFPCIKKKAEWAKKWINDKESSFASRLVAFAVVEGIFFSSSFASIYWIKKRGMLHGLTLSNEFISRDEALHVEFAVLLYHKLVNKLSKETFYKIMTEAVEIEKEFILEAIPCRLIGMNSTLMSQYIEFVTNRLCLQLGYDKLFPNATNPFDFMELISLNDKVNFFEKTNTQYALANKSIEGDPFDLSSEF
jgi:ribonucleotide reductase beta subunit family protein with ferritin-like domain